MDCRAFLQQFMIAVTSSKNDDHDPRYIHGEVTGCAGTSREVSCVFFRRTYFFVFFVAVVSSNTALQHGTPTRYCCTMSAQDIIPLLDGATSSGTMSAQDIVPLLDGATSSGGSNGSSGGRGSGGRGRCGARSPALKRKGPPSASNGARPVQAARQPKRRRTGGRRPRGSGSGNGNGAGAGSGRRGGHGGGGGGGGGDTDNKHRGGAPARGAGQKVGAASGVGVGTAVGGSGSGSAAAGPAICAPPNPAVKRRIPRSADGLAPRKDVGGVAKQAKRRGTGGHGSGGGDNGGSGGRRRNDTASRRRSGSSRGNGSGSRNRHGGGGGGGAEGKHRDDSGSGSGSGLTFLSTAHMDSIGNISLKQRKHKAQKSENFFKPEAKTVRAAAHAKAELVGRYASAGVRKYLHTWARGAYGGTVLTYVDTHSGGGVYKGADGSEQDGTAVTMLKLLKTINTKPAGGPEMVGRNGDDGELPTFEMVLMEGNEQCIHNLADAVRDVLDLTPAAPNDWQWHFAFTSNSVNINVHLYRCDSVEVLTAAVDTPHVEIKNVLLFVDPFADQVRMQDLKRFATLSTHSDIIMYAAIQTVVRMKGAYETDKSKKWCHERLNAYLDDAWQKLLVKGQCRESQRGVRNCALVCDALARKLGLTYHTMVRMTQAGSTYGLVLATNNSAAFTACKEACHDVDHALVRDECFEFVASASPEDSLASRLKVASVWLHALPKGKWLELSPGIQKHVVLVESDVNLLLKDDKGAALAPLFVIRRASGAKMTRSTVKKAQFRFFACASCATSTVALQSAEPSFWVCVAFLHVHHKLTCTVCACTCVCLCARSTASVS